MRLSLRHWVLAGDKRAMSLRSRIGFHAVYIKDWDEKRESGAGNALLGAYLAQLGLSQNAIAYVTHASPESMEWLTLENARSVGIDVLVFETADAPVTPAGYSPLMPSGFVPASVPAPEPVYRPTISGGFTEPPQPDFTAYPALPPVVYAPACPPYLRDIPCRAVRTNDAALHTSGLPVARSRTRASITRAGAGLIKTVKRKKQGDT